MDAVAKANMTPILPATAATSQNGEIRSVNSPDENQPFQKQTNTVKTKTPTKSNDLSKEQIEILDKISKWVVAPINSLTTVSGVFSFLLPNVFDKKSELVDKISDWSSFGAIWSTSGFSLLNRFWQRDAIGVSAFTTDLVTSFLGDGEMRYQWKGWGSGQDHGPLILGELSTNKKIIAAYSLDENNEKEAKKQFQNYSGFEDSAKKMLYGTQVIAEDIYEDIKNNGFLKGLKNSFLTGERSAERNLLVSGAGILVGAFIGTILGIVKLGSTVRDVLGIHADFAYIYKGLSKVIAGKETLSDLKDHDKAYMRAGVEYTAGSALDLIYRWTGIEGLNYTALGFDRFGAMEGAFGILKEAKFTQSEHEKSVLAKETEERANSGYVAPVLSF
jgi:hypothetical protein